MLFMKVEMFGTPKSAMPLSFSNFDFLAIYKAESAGSRTYSFGRNDQGPKRPRPKRLGPKRPRTETIQGRNDPGPSVPEVTQTGSPLLGSLRSTDVPFRSRFTQQLEEEALGYRSVH